MGYVDQYALSHHGANSRAPELAQSEGRLWEEASIETV
jgi:hypothetical protein